MPNDARIEELAHEAANSPDLELPGDYTENLEAAIRLALRTAIREAREEQIKADAKFVKGFEFAWLAAEALLDQLPTKKG